MREVRVTPITATGFEVTAPHVGGIGTETGRPVVREKEELFALGLIDQPGQVRARLPDAPDAVRLLDQLGKGQLGTAETVRATSTEIVYLRNNR